MQDREERVIAYVSKSLEGSEQRYCTARKELLAVVRALKHFKCYLYGQKITVRTDNSTVSWLHRSKRPSRTASAMDRGDRHLRHYVPAPAGLKARKCGRPLPVPVPTVQGRLCRGHSHGSAGGDQESEMRAGLDPGGDGRRARRRSRYRPPS